MVKQEQLKYPPVSNQQPDPRAQLTLAEQPALQQELLPRTLAGREGGPQQL